MRCRGNALTVYRILTVALALMLTPAAALAGPRAIVFPFDLVDESQQYEMGVMPKGVSDEEKRRLALITEELAKLKRPVEIYITHLKPSEIELTMQEIEELPGDLRPRPLQNNHVFEF